MGGALESVLKVRDDPRLEMISGSAVNASNPRA